MTPTEPTPIQPLAHAALLRDTRRFYERNPRAYDASTGTCRYLGSNGTKCALGRWIDYMKVSDGDVRRFNVRDAQGLLHGLGRSLESILKPEVAHIRLSFWIDLQALHDRDAYWKSSPEGFSLTLDGVEFYKRTMRGARSLDSARRAAA